MKIESHHKAYILAVFCIFFQVGICLGVKLVFSLLGDVPSISEKVIIYSVSLFLMGIYAILWQLVLHSVDLSVANSMMSIVPVLTFGGGVFFFNEEISIFNIIGFFMIIVGLLMIFNSKKTKRDYAS